MTPEIYYGLVGADVFAPLIAIIGWWLLRRYASTRYWKLIRGCGLLLALVVAGRLLGIRLYPRSLELALLAFAYLCLCFLLTASFSIRRLLLRIPSMILAAVPIACAYALVTWPFALLTVFVVGEWLETPRYIEKMNDRLVCRVTVWSTTFSGEGYTVHLYRIAPLAPIFEREVVAIVVDETDPGNGPSSATCADAMKAYAG